MSFDRRKARTAGKPGERKHRGFNGPWAGREIEMLESPAFRALSLSGHRMLARIEIELARHAGRDNGKLPVTYDDFIRYGIGDRRTVAATEREIEALGFARIIRGRAGNREYRRPNLFRLTYKATDDGAAPTNEWRHVQRLDEAKYRASVARENVKRKRVTVRENPTLSGGETPPVGTAL